jgi:hypothetical protein
MEHEIEAVPGYSVGARRYKNWLFPLFVTNVPIVDTFKFKSDDTFIVTYPKSGN